MLDLVLPQIDFVKSVQASSPWSDERQPPPTGITGAANTSKRRRKPGEARLEAKIDYCAFSIPTHPDPDLPGPRMDSPFEVISLILRMNPEDFVEAKKGGNHYRRRLIFGDISVFFDGHRKDMGVYVEMRGKGCRQWEHERGEEPWLKLFGRVTAYSGSFSRLDLAIDDKPKEDERPQLSLRTIRAAMNPVRGYTVQGEMRLRDGSVGPRVPTRVRTPFQKMTKHLDLDPSTGLPEGDGVYFGSPSSLVRVRVYDKALEQSCSGHWLRVELQLRDERADAVVSEILYKGAGGVGFAVAGVLYRYLQFVDPCNDENFSRWPDSVWWLNFLGNVEKLRLTTAPDPKTMDRHMRWLQDQFGTSVAMVYEYFLGKVDDVSEVWPKFYDWIRSLLDYGLKRMKPKHWAVVNAIVKPASEWVDTFFDDAIRIDNQNAYEEERRSDVSLAWSQSALVFA